MLLDEEEGWNASRGILGISGADGSSGERDILGLLPDFSGELASLVLLSARDTGSSLSVPAIGSTGSSSSLIVTRFGERDLERSGDCGPSEMSSSSGGRGATIAGVGAGGGLGVEILGDLKLLRVAVLP